MTELDQHPYWVRHSGIEGHHHEWKSGHCECGAESMNVYKKRVQRERNRIAREFKEREKTMPEAKKKIAFDPGTQEGFEVFADEVAAEIPGTDLTFVDRPMFGQPYIIIKINRGDPWNEFTLIVDKGDHLCVGDNLFWVERV